MVVKLDKEKLIVLIKEADDKWFASHPTGWKYNEHLNHTADYIARNYNRKRRGNGHRNSTPRAVIGERKGSHSGKKTPDDKNLFSLPSPGGRRRAKV